MASIMSLLSGQLTIPAGLGVWEDIIRWMYSFIGDYGCTVILIAVVLKLLMFPLDYFQRKSTAKTQAIQMRLQPQLNKLKEKYKDDKNMLNQKTMELYKKENVGMFGSCGIMLLYMVVTLFVFMTLFFGMNNIAKNVNVEQYNELRATYELAVDQGKTEDEINKAVLDKYNDIKTSWLWIENIWRPDRTVSPIASFNEYASTAGISKKDADYEQKKAEYEEVMNPLRESVRGSNGYFVLIILAAVVTFLSSWLSTRMMKKKKKKEEPVDQGRIVSAKGERERPDKSQNPLAGKIMMIVLPLIMVFITWGYNAAFALYIVTMSACGAIINYVLSWIFSKKQDELSKPNNDKNKIQVVKPDYVRQ